jgi:hypothetical protein
MSQLETSTIASFSFAHIGNLVAALNASITHSDDPRVIDSGASYNMIGMSSLFSSYIPCSGREKVRIADGSLSLVSSKGSISSTPYMTLFSVLHVPDFAPNLLSITPITCELNCRVFFILMIFSFWT